MLRAVLDANIYISALLRPQGPPGQIVERFLREGAFQLILSLAIAEEVLRAFAYPKIRKLVRGPVQAELWFEDLLVLAEMVEARSEVAVVGADPDDDKYLAAAIDGRATYVVTGDRQFLSLREYEQVRIVTPRVFLEVLRAEAANGRK